MGTIVPRKRRDGSIGYTAQIRIKRAGKVIHTEAETFEREAAARAWMKKREYELSQPGALDPKPEVKDPPVSEVIDQYNREKLKEHGKTKTQVLRTIAASPFGKLRCSQATSQAVVDYASGLTSQPQTVLNYMSHLASIYTVARPAWGYPLDPQAMADAMVVLRKLGRVARSNQRDRRPTFDELDKLLKHFEVALLKAPHTLPMPRLVLFAMFSTRRQEEITRLSLKDLDRQHLEIIVRDMKNPGEKIGNDVRTQLPEYALRLIDAQLGAPKKQPKKGKDRDLIFPYNPQSISTSFARACETLGIEDLHFHDLRHEGISWLFEQGNTIPQVACVSGHRSWTSLKRYTHMRAQGDKYANWAWLNKLAPPRSN